jgi:signal peptidase I
MLPTLSPNDYCIVNRIGALARVNLGYSLRRGDIVVIRAPQIDAIVVKRVIAVGGDRIRILQGQVILNGKPLREAYVPKKVPSGSPLDSWPLDMESPGLRDVVVPPHSCFILGDNRDESFDSRTWGAVPDENVVGSVLFIWHQRTSSSISALRSTNIVPIGRVKQLTIGASRL